MPDATNYLPNGGFETNDTGWAVAGTATKTRQTTGGAFGAAYLQVDVTAINGGVTLLGGAQAGQATQHAASYYIRAKTPGDVGKTIAMFIDTAGGSYEQFKVTHVLTADWTRVVRTLTFANAGHTNWRITVRSEISAAAGFDIDAAQYEDGLAATDYIDTSGTILSRKDAEAALEAAATILAAADPIVKAAEAVLTAVAALVALPTRSVDIWAQHDYLQARENAQALEYRRMAQAREANQAAREAALVGSAAAQTRQEANWSPLRRWPGWEPERLVKGEPA